MKKIIISVSFVVLIGVISGCNNGTQNNNQVQEKKTNSVKTIEKMPVKKIENTNNGQNEQAKVDKIENQNIEEILGDNNVPENEIADIKAQTKDIKECDEGFVYNTELNECFKLGATTDNDKDVEAKIDPVVKKCIDKGGIYNAQMEKCFIK